VRNVLLLLELTFCLYRKKYKRIATVLQEAFSPSPASEIKISAKLVMYSFLPIKSYFYNTNVLLKFTYVIT